MKHVRVKRSDSYYVDVGSQDLAKKYLVILSYKKRPFYYFGQYNAKLNDDEVGLSNAQAVDLQLSLADLILIDIINNDLEIKSEKLDLNVTNIPSKDLNVDLLKWEELFRRKFFGMILFKEQSHYFTFNGIKFRLTNIGADNVRIAQGTSIKLVSTNDQLYFYMPETERKRDDTLTQSVPTSVPAAAATISTESSDTMCISQFSKNSLNDLGIGGLQEQFDLILRRIFASRLLDPTIVKQLGLKHVKGMILYGPPGTGKTLLARQFSKLISNIEPIVVNGPEIKNRYVGASEENMRRLFEKAQKDRSNKVHVIIFDEIDAICRERGSGGSSSGVEDSLVNQLLTMMDGIKSLNNILVIGLTNRKDMLDPALLRPGRFELQLRIGLPNFVGRQEIFRIYLQPFRNTGSLHLTDTEYADLIIQLARQTPNYSGAEIDAIVKAAVSFALNREIDWEKNREMIRDLELRVEDLTLALGEITPQWSGCRGRLPARYDEYWTADLIDNCVGVCNSISTSSLSSGCKILIHGEVGSGKTQWLREISDNLGRDVYVLYIDTNLSAALRDLEVVQPDYLFLDDLPDLCSFIPLGCRYNSDLVLKLKHYLKSPMNIIATTSNITVIKDLGLLEYFKLVKELTP